MSRLHIKQMVDENSARYIALYKEGEFATPLYILSHAEASQLVVDIDRALDIECLLETHGDTQCVLFGNLDIVECADNDE